MSEHRYRAPNCFRQRLHVAAKGACASCDLARLCPFGFNINDRPLVNELRMDFADSGACNLNCKLCWAKTWDSEAREFSTSEIIEALRTCLGRLSESMHALVASGHIRTPEYFAFSDLQITGGEPLLNKARAEHVVTVVRELDAIVENHPELMELFKRRKTGPYAGRIRVRLFTNGVAIGKGQIGPSELMSLRSLRYLHVDVMVSLKGTNADEFQSLQVYSSRRPHGSHEDQVAGLSALKQLEQAIGVQHLSAYLVFGMYHSDRYDVLCGNCRTDPPFSDWSESLRRVVAKHFQDGKFIFVEPVKNPYSGRGGVLAAQWEREMGGLLSAPGTLEPDLRKGRGRNIVETRIAHETFETIRGGSALD